MTWNFRIMRRYQHDKPDMFWYEIVEVYYGEDGIPMMWGDSHGPIVTDLDIELDSNDQQDLETFVKTNLTEQFAQLMRDIDGRGPILDERDFEKGGVYSDHPDAVQLQKDIEDISNMNSETIARLRAKLDEEDEDEI